MQKKSLNKQIGGKSNNQRSLISCLKILIEDIELYADIKLLNYLKEITLKKQKKSYKFTLQIYSTLNYIIQRQKHKFSDLMIINFQQIQQQNKQIEIQTIDPNLVRNFRLMNFEKLNQIMQKNVKIHQQYYIKDEKGIAIQQIRLSKNSKIIFQCKLSLCFNLGTFSNHLIKVSKDPNYDLNPINKSFDEKFYKLSPDFILDEFKLLEDPKINQIFHFINYLMEQLIQILILLILQWI